MCDSERSILNFWRKYSFIGMSQNKRTAKMGEQPNLLSIAEIPSTMYLSSKSLLWTLSLIRISLFLGISQSNILIECKISIWLLLFPFPKNDFQNQLSIFFYIFSFTEFSFKLNVQGLLHGWLWAWSLLIFSLVFLTTSEIRVFTLKKT